MTNFNFYHSLSDEAKNVIRSLMPKGWRPPPDPWNKKLINLDTAMEDLQEIGELMKIPTKWDKYPPK